MLNPSTESTELLTLLHAFDRLFDKAASKLNIEYTPQEREEARRNFTARFREMLESCAHNAGLSGVSEDLMQEREAAIEELSPANIAGYMAVGPLAVQLQKLMRAVAAKAAEQRMLEHLISHTDDRYGGN